MTTIPANFTLDDLLSYLRNNEVQQEGYYTTDDWSRRFGVSVAKMRNILREAKGAGRLRQATTHVERLDGINTPVPAYAFILDDPGEDKKQGR